jgi:glutathionylspermidine synthase
MRPIRNFDEFIREHIVKKQSIDRPRAEFLIRESENSYNNLHEMIDKLGLDDDNANIFVKSCYDILMEMIRAKMLLDGFNASGFGAHEAEVSYMRMLGFNENDVQFADQIRYFRNGMLYYGTMLEKVYAEKVIDLTNRTYKKLKEMTL